MKRKKLNIDIMNSSLKRSELREITAGCGSSGGSGGGQECNCLYCELQNGGLEMFYSSGCDDPPNWACRFYTGDWFATGSYGIC
jgi:hypothetical protein